MCMTSNVINASFTGDINYKCYKSNDFLLCCKAADTCPCCFHMRIDFGNVVWDVYTYISDLLDLTRNKMLSSS
jgi:hypothetical protein